MSGTIVGGRPFSTAPNIEIDWAVTSQSTANNTSTVRARVYLRAPYQVVYSATKSGRTNIGGTTRDWTNSTNRNGTGRWLLNTWSRTVRHNNDGTASVAISAWYDLNITMSGGRVNRLTASQTVSLPRIARASTISNASMRWTQQLGNGNALVVNLNRQNNSFTHNISLHMGNFQVHSWSGTNGGELSIPEARMTEVINRMSNSTSTTLQARVQTRSGSTNIGSVVTRNVTLNLHSNIAPTISGFGVSVAGNGLDNQIGRYVQGVTQPRVTFNAQAPQGAHLSTTRVRREWQSGSSGGDTQHGTAGEWRNGRNTSRLQGHGVLRITAEAVDSRGRTTTRSTDITVQAYRSPRITAFTVERTSGTNVSYTRNGNWDHLGGGNNLQILVRKRVVGSSSWTQVESLNVTNSGTGSFGATRTNGGNDRTTSYEFQLEVTDGFGNSASAVQTIGTGDVPMVWGRDNVGIGKYPEEGNGVLDVGGNMTVAGGVFPQADAVNGGDSWNQFDDGITMMNITNQSGYPNAFGTLVTHKIGQHRFFQIFSQHDSGRTTGGGIYWRTHHGGIGWGDWVKLDNWRGDNSNGYWVTLGDGTHICWHSNLNLTYAAGNTADGTWTFPRAFTSPPHVYGNRTSIRGGSHQPHSGDLTTEHAGGGTNFSGSTYIRYQNTSQDISFVSGRQCRVNVLAIGRREW